MATPTVGEVPRDPVRDQVDSDSDSEPEQIDDGERMVPVWKDALGNLTRSKPTKYLLIPLEEKWIFEEGAEMGKIPEVPITANEDVWVVEYYYPIKSEPGSKKRSEFFTTKELAKEYYEKLKPFVGGRIIKDTLKMDGRNLIRNEIPNNWEPNEEHETDMFEEMMKKLNAVAEEAKKSSEFNLS